MAIRKKQEVLAGLAKKQVKAGISTHTENEQSVEEMTSDFGVTNNMDAYKLYDPDEITEDSVSTHFPNDEEVKSGKKVKASTNVGTLDNDVDPAAGYLDQAQPGDEVTDQGVPSGPLFADAEDAGDEADSDMADEAEIESTEEVDSDDDFDEDADDESEDWDEDDEPAPEDFDLDSDDVIKTEEQEEFEDELPIGTTEANSEDFMDLVDIDGVPEDDVEAMVFANLGSKVLVLKANRVIASMSKKQALKAGCEDVYQLDQFHDASFEEAKRQGLRAGLKQMGFVLASVNVGSSAVLNKRVESKVITATADSRKIQAEKEKSFNQCLAIASVGITRRFFKEQASNQLIASLVDQLNRAGVRNGQRIVNAAFAQHGVDYSKAIITVAQRLSAMPAEHRAQFASALDMLDEDGEFIESDAVFEDESVSDFVDAEAQDEFMDDGEEDYVPASVTAALSNPGREFKGELLTAKRQRGTSLSAHALLTGNDPLTFL